MSLTKKEISVMFAIDFWSKGYPEGIEQFLSIKKIKAKQILRELEKKGLIKIEIREGQIYGSVLTEEGIREYEKEKYLKWKCDLGY